MLLLPLSIRDWLAPEHLAWFVIDAVESMDLAPFYAKYRSNGQGSAAWHPKTMVALLLYAYCQGERSSRRLEKLCEESVPYRVITGNEQPDPCSISRFRQDNAAAMKGLFVEILRLCAEAGLVKVGKVNLDGTKMKANTSLAANRMVLDGRALPLGRESGNVSGPTRARPGRRNSSTIGSCRAWLCFGMSMMRICDSADARRSVHLTGHLPRVATGGVSDGTLAAGMNRRRRSRPMRKGLLLAVLVPLLAATLCAGVEVPYAEYREIELDSGGTILALGGFFRAEKPTFGVRSCLVTVNGMQPSPDALLSPRTVLQVRHSRWSFARIHEETLAVTFPYTHRSGGLADFTYAGALEYDRWTPLYNDFPQTLYIDLNRVLPDRPATLRVRITNTSDGPTGSIENSPPFVVETCRLFAQRPDTDDYGEYVPSIWHVLQESPAQAARARAALADPACSDQTRAQILAQFGLRQQVHGNDAAAAALYRDALAAAPGFPERNELLFRLLALGQAPGTDRIEETDDNPGAWARLFNAYRRAAAGETGPTVRSVPPYDGPFTVDGRPEDPIWNTTERAWTPLAHPVTRPSKARPENRVLLFHSPAGLGLVFRGPGLDRLQPFDHPGDDRPVWNWNCVELFLAPFARFTEYFELNTSAANGRYDGRHSWRGETNDRFDGTWQSAARTRDGVLTVEYLVPWSDFGLTSPPAPGSLWVGNVVRVQHVDLPDGSREVTEHSAARLLWRHFHRLQDGLVLRFE